jgi:hypothetical protein
MDVIIKKKNKKFDPDLKNMDSDTNSNLNDGINNNNSNSIATTSEKTQTYEQFLHKSGDSNRY